MKMTCPICETKIELPKNTKIGERMTCPTCFAQLALYKHEGKHVLACALCKNPTFDVNECGDCERRKEKKRVLIEEGKL